MLFQHVVSARLRQPHCLDFDGRLIKPRAGALCRTGQKVSGLLYNHVFIPLSQRVYRHSVAASRSSLVDIQCFERHYQHCVLRAHLSETRDARDSRIVNRLRGVVDHDLFS